MKILPVVGFCILLSIGGYSTRALAEPLPLHLAQAAPPENQLSTAEEFKRLYAFVLASDETNARFPGEVAKLLGWSRGEDIFGRRRGLSQRRGRDNALLRQYAVDIPPVKLARPVLVIFQMIPGDAAGNVPSDTTMCFVFDENGRLFRTIEMWPERNYAVKEIRDGSHDKLGYDVWRFLLSRLPENVSQ